MQKVFKKIKEFYAFLINWNEIITLPIAITILVFAGPFLRNFDATAGIYDFGWFQKPLYAIMVFILLHAFSWVMIKLTFPKAYKYLEEIFETNIDEGKAILTEWQKSIISVSLFFFYVSCLVLLMLSA